MGKAAADKSTALWVLRRLRTAGFQSLFAGGCVRDMLLGVRCSDYDIATDAEPGQVKKLFRRVLLIGAKFGVAMVIHNGRKVEVTTFRSDLSYSDGRRPDGVRFSSPQEDAERRDFTINGMFYDPIADEVIDYVGGRADLKSGVIRTIGDPDRRFAEDYLRMIRAVRFATRLGFSIAPETAEAVRKHAPKITSISGERIFDEMSKMLSHKSAARSLALLGELGLAGSILPELFRTEGQWKRAEARAECVAARCDMVLSLGALLAGLEPNAIPNIVRRWGASNQLRNSLKFFSAHLDGWRKAADCALADFKRLMASRDFDRLRRLWLAEEKLQTGGSTQSRRIAKRAAGVDPEKITPRPFVTGADLSRMGLCEGPKVGRILHAVYEAQLNEEISSRSKAMKLARELAEK